MVFIHQNNFSVSSKRHAYFILFAPDQNGELIAHHFYIAHHCNKDLAIRFQFIPLWREEADLL